MLYLFKPSLTNILQNVNIVSPEMEYYLNVGQLDLNNSLLILPLDILVRYDSVIHTLIVQYIVMGKEAHNLYTWSPPNSGMGGWHSLTS